MQPTCYELSFVLRLVPAEWWLLIPAAFSHRLEIETWSPSIVEKPFRRVFHFRGQRRPAIMRRPLYAL